MAQEPAVGAEVHGGYADVALSLPVSREFTYAVPPGVRVRVGNRVRVPFRGKVRAGVVTARRSSCELPEDKVRPILEVLDDTLVLPPAVLELSRRIAAEYGCSLGEALDATLPGAAKRRGARRVPHLVLAVDPDRARAAIDELEDRFQPRARVLRAVLEYGAPMPVLLARRRAGTSDSPWRTLVRQGLLRRVLLPEEAQPLEIDLSEENAHRRHELNEDQRRAVDAICEVVRARRHETFLLHGVTGSGKTEVYLRVLEEVRAQGRGAIVLVPEISLTPQTVGRFAARFPDVAVLHSGLTDGQRAQQWRRLLEGRAGVAIGARSALFAPLADVGLIVVDEEHESTFKQENTPRYHAREMAVVRGRIENAAVVLGSATPSLESYGRARRGVHRLLELPRRAGPGTLPRVVVEDLRRAGKEAWIDGVPLSRTLRIHVEERLRARDQVILFLNRRGWAPVLICPSCGTPVRCRRCDISMCLHAGRGRLVCHYCYEERRRPEVCEVCSHVGFRELGLGTERLAAVVTKLFPSAVVARMDTDSMTKRGAHEQVLTAFRRKQIDVLVGTQMVAKGHDFPDVTLVGIVLADVGLLVPDFRAAERTFQLLQQVAGRAGRADKPGLVVLQTHCPDNYAVRAAADLDYEAFVEQELRYRKETGYPPFSRLVRVLVEARDARAARRVADEVRASIPGSPERQVLGPAPAPLPRIKERHRWHLLVKSFTASAFDGTMAALRDVEERTTRTLRVTLDVDPGAMM